MSEPTPEFQSLEERVAHLQAELDRLEADKKAPLWKRVLAGFGAALTSPTAIKEEKSIAALVLGRLTLTAPALAVLIDLALKALGAPSVSP